MPPPAHPIQEDFSAGEISPLMTGRTDLQTFRAALQESVNMYSIPQGPITERNGSKFIDDHLKPTGNIRYIRHQPNSQEGFILVFTDQQVEMYRASDEVKVFTLAVPYLDADIFDLRFTFSVDSIFITGEIYPVAEIQRILDSNWQYVLATFIDGPFLPQDDIQEITTLQVTSQDFQLRLIDINASGAFTTSIVNDYVEYIELKDRFLGQVITKLSNDEVVIRPVSFIARNLATNAIYNVDIGNSRLMCDKLTFTTDLENTFARVVDSNDSDIVKWIQLGKMIGVLDGSASGWNHDQDAANIDDDADAIEMITDPVTFVVAPGDVEITVAVNTGNVVSDTANTFTASTDVGRQLRITIENTPVWGTITVVNNDKSVDLAFEEFVPRDPDLNTFANNGQTRDWRLGAFYIGNFPRACAFIQQRFALGGTPTAPENFWLSRPNKFFTFSTSDQNNQVNDDSAIAVQLSGAQLNKIRWMKEARALVIGTEGSEWVIFSSVAGGAITPTSIRAESQSENGSILEPVTMGGVLVFYQLSGRKLREFDFNDDNDRYDSNDISLQAEHLLRNDTFAVDVDRMKEPYPMIWSTRIDGKFLSTTYIGNQGLASWAQHFLGGPDAKVLTMATVRHINATFEEVYLCVERTIGGGPKRYMEKFTMEFFPDDVQDKDDMRFVDSFKVVDVPTPVTFGDKAAGFDHLIGTTVTPVVNGSVQPEQIVDADGEITLEKKVTLPVGGTVRIVVGYNYRAFIHTLQQDWPTQSGSIQGKIKRVDRVTIKFYNSLGIKLGNDLDNLKDPISFRQTSALMDQSPDFVTDDREFSINMEYNRLADFYIVQDQPYPLTILQISPEVKGTK